MGTAIGAKKFTASILPAATGKSRSQSDSDAASNFYGTTIAGHNFAAGSVFEMSPDGGEAGQRSCSIVWRRLDGASPQAASRFRWAGNLYRRRPQAAFMGWGWSSNVAEWPRGLNGSVSTPLTNTTGYDSVAGLSSMAPAISTASPSTGATTSTELRSNYRPTAEVAGRKPCSTVSARVPTERIPRGTLIWDGAGNLYGTTTVARTQNVGSVFELSPNGSGGWTEALLYSFNNNGLDGTYPYAGVTFDSAGNLDRTTFNGGTYNYGSLFELTPIGGGSWTETVLHSFNLAYPYTDGDLPRRSDFDGAGNLFGTTVNGGTGFYGTAYEFSPDGRGGWTETVLHDFSEASDGGVPDGGLIMDHAGNLYGTTAVGGIGGPVVGTVFEITR